MKLIYKIWSMFLLFRAGFIHAGYHNKPIKVRVNYAYVYAHQWIKAGAGDYKNRHVDKNIRKQRRALKKLGSNQAE